MTGLKLFASLVCVIGSITAALPQPSAAGKPLPATACLMAARQAAAAEGIPPDLLVSIALAESGRTQKGATVPWPWTVNSEGRGWWFETKQAAIAQVRRLQGQGHRSIDVGCFQVNLRWHQDAFASLDQAFDPPANAAYAAQFLAELRRAFGLESATGRYPSATPALSARYRARVVSRRDRAEALLAALPADGLRQASSVTAFLFAPTGRMASFRSLFAEGEPQRLPGAGEQ